MTDFTVGVEEEFFLVDPGTGMVRPHAERVLHASGPADAQAELHRWQEAAGRGRPLHRETASGC